MSSYMNESSSVAAAYEHHHEAAGLEARLSDGQIIGLALASQTPAVALATVPFLLVVTAGNGSWLGALLAAVATGCVGAAVITFARRYVVTGSLYSYIAYVFGPWARLLVGASLLLGYVALIAGVLMLTATFAGSFLIAVGFGWGLSAGSMTVLATVAMLLAAGLAYRGLDASVRTAVILTVATVPVVLYISVAAAINTGLDLGAQLSLNGASVSGIFQGVAAAAVFLVAFESSAALAAETRNSRRNVPVAVMSIPVVLGAAYLMMAVLQVPALLASAEAINAGGSPAAALVEQAGLGAPLATATDLILAIANLASLIAFVNYGSRFVATLATDGLLPKSAAHVNKRFKSPDSAILSLSALALASLLVLVWLYPDELLTKVFPAISTLTVYMWVIPWALICVGAIVLVVRERRARLGIVTTAAFGATAVAWIYVNGLVNAPASPVDAMSYVYLIATGALFVVFYLLDWRSRRPRGRRQGIETGDDNRRSPATWK
ncbi:APC family permease [Micromonospora sp. NPDC047707]|uniref:APC family permease n=1 Tax=Micromonospora sp. NPDC047707 TaxID=3154498 RepID=UPI003454497B